jgi:hypothetical protein
MISKDFTGWKYYTFDNDEGQPVNIGIKYTFDNGLTHCVLLQDPEVQAWLALGNTPLPAEE